MTARILDGNKIRDQIFEELKDEVRVLTSAGIRPGPSIRPELQSIARPP